MSYREFVQWQAFNSISPIGDERTADTGPALIRQHMTNLVSKKGAQSIPLADYLPFRQAPPQPENDLDAALIAWARSHGAS